jgi:hypothetical protein
MKIRGKEIKVSGRLVRVARMDGDKFEFPDDPEAAIAELRNCGTRVDLFTFLQRLPDTTQRLPYPMEWDNLAVLPISTFENWFNKQIRSYPRKGNLRYLQRDPRTPGKAIPPLWDDARESAQVRVNVSG